MSAALTALCTVGILAVIPGLSLLYREFLDRTGALASALLTAAICACAFALWLVVGFFVPAVASSPLYLPAASLAALSGFLASLTVRDTTTHVAPALLYSLAWTALVYTPVAVIVLFPTSVGLSPATGPLDLGGALPVHVAVGSGALVVLTVARGWSVADRSHVRPRSWLLLTSGLVIWAGCIAGYVGLNLSVDDVVTPLIVTNTIVAPILAILGWLIVQRIRSATTTAIGAIAGLVAGLVAIAAGCAYFTPLWAGVTGAAAGIAGSIFVSGWVRATHRHAWFIVGAHLLAAVVGLVMLGIFGTNSGFIFDGQIDLFVAQVVAIVLVSVWAAAISLLLWLMVRGIALRANQRSARSDQGVGSSAS
jgi:Amt family ammonium transporter